MSYMMTINLNGLVGTLCSIKIDSNKDFNSFFEEIIRLGYHNNYLIVLLHNNVTIFYCNSDFIPLYVGSNRTLKQIFENRKEVNLTYIKIQEEHRNNFKYFYLNMEDHKDKFNDPNFMRIACIKRESNYVYLKDEFKEDFNFNVLLVRINKHLIGYILAKYRDDTKFMYNFLLKNIDDTYNFNYLSERLKNDKNFFELFIWLKPLCIQYASETIRNDFNFMSKLIWWYGDKYNLIHYSLDNIRDNKNFMMNFLWYYPEYYNYASTFLKKDLELGLQVFEKDIEQFKYADNELRSNYNIIMFLVEKNQFKLITTEIINNSSEDVKNDYNIMLYLINNDCNRFGKFIGEKLYSNSEFVNSIQELNYHILVKLSEDIKNNLKLMLSLIKKNKQSYNTYDYSKCIGDNLKDSEDFIEAALDINPNFIYLASHKIRHNKKILEKVIQLNKNYHIDYLDKDSEISNDKSFMINYYSNHLSCNICVDCIGNKLKDDENFIKDVMEYNPKIIKIAPPEIKHNKEILKKVIEKDNEFCINLVKKDSDIIIDDELTFIIYLKLYKNNYIKKLPIKLKYNKKIIKYIIKNDSTNKKVQFRHVPNELKDDEEFIQKLLEDIDNEEIKESIKKYASLRIRHKLKFRNTLKYNFKDYDEDNELYYSLNL